MNRYSRLMGILILSLLALNVAGTAAQGPAPQAAPITSTFNYQGRIIKDGVPITSTCAIEFKLFDASTGGNQIGTTQTHGSVTVKAGLFTVALNFGDSAFTGDQRYLQVAFKCSGDANWTTMSPRQPLTAVPYALSLRPVWSGRGNRHQHQRCWHMGRKPDQYRSTGHQSKRRWRAWASLELRQWCAWQEHQWRYGCKGRDYWHRKRRCIWRQSHPRSGCCRCC